MNAISQIPYLTEKISFCAEDGYPIQATLYRNSDAKATIVLASATGVPQAFYRRFAEYAVQHGFQVLSFDYRGIAASAPKTLRHFKMCYLDWGRLDLSAAIDVAKQQQQPIFVIGHSYGGQALGLCRNHADVQAIYCFGTGAGWHGYMPFKERLKVQVFWKLVFPPLVQAYGYLPWQKLNMGANLPRDVYKQWRRWCQYPRYFFDDPELTALHECYAAVKTPIYAVAALDDDWALPASRHAFMQHYKNAKLHYIYLKPEEFSLNNIGHMGYFRKGAEPIWQQMLDHLKQTIGS